MSYIPPEFAQEPMEITQRGSIICCHMCRTRGAIFLKTVPATIMRSASRGDPRMISEPKRDNVELARQGGGELHIAAGQAEVEGPEGIFAAPGHEIGMARELDVAEGMAGLVEFFHDLNPCLSRCSRLLLAPQSKAPVFHRYASPATVSSMNTRIAA